MQFSSPGNGKLLIIIFELERLQEKSMRVLKTTLEAEMFVVKVTKQVCVLFEGLYESGPTIGLNVVCLKPEFNVILFCFFTVSWFKLEVNPFKAMVGNLFHKHFLLYFLKFSLHLSSNKSNALTQK